jgi:hypothetical protein
MKNTIKRGVSAVLLAVGIASLAGCISYTRHDTDYAYRAPYWTYRLYDDRPLYGSNHD